MKKEIPLGIKILSIFNFIAAAIIFIAVFALGFFGLAEGRFGLGLTGLLLLLSIVPVFIGIGLRKGKSWARWLEMIISILGIIWFLYSAANLIITTPEEYLIELQTTASEFGVDPSYYTIEYAKQEIQKSWVNGIFNFIINGIIILYLGFNKGVKAFFTKTQKA